MPRRLTATDVCAVSGYTRDELHATLKVLWPYREEKAAPRVARQFTPHDLVVLSVTQTLESRLGLRRAALSVLGEPLRAALSGPKEASRKARLVISIDPSTVEYLDRSITEKEGLVVALGPIFEKVDDYLSYGGQGILPLAPEVISSRVRKAN
ncbi:hypothetical protein FN976_16940 [Caenimonas sedimenti]|uniref:MerR family transcriptional regulator n=1 Tax=Caenimonas sedimenti TaxID=2596921 RepID=A0A562ZN68_9BURK|nr:hypothetical protein [Caenimonas sedimenti]TWO70029.1 hypothetical protein FN976_16940 [Caenimonas sedimenti]